MYDSIDWRRFNEQAVQRIGLQLEVFTDAHLVKTFTVMLTKFIV